MINFRKVFARSLILVLAASFVGCTTMDSGMEGQLITPEGYQLSNAQLSSAQRDCVVFPPNSDDIVVPSKYEGSGKDRATLNEESNAQYKKLTEDINAFATYIASMSRRIQRGDASHGEFDCWLNNLSAWAQADALLPENINMTGKAVQKWTLATLASHYLVLKPLIKTSDAQAAQVEEWFAKIAVQVMSHYSDRPLRKINNHDYWAAWAVLNVSIITQNNAMFKYSLSVFDTAMSQINEQGLLPNELKRQSRAFSYHNYAMLPLASMAGLFKANGVNFNAANRNNIFRLANTILASQPAERFASYTGSAQSEYVLDDGSHLAWVAALAYVDSEKDHWMENLNRYKGWKKHRYSRLGTGGCSRYLC